MTTHTFPSHKTHKQELLKDPEFKKAYDDLEPAYKIACALIEARLGKKLTQAEVADKVGVSREVIARLESGTGNPTIGSISRVASVLGKELKLVDSSRPIKNAPLRS